MPRTVSQDVRDVLIVTIFKRKGERTECGNHRRISLLAVAGKVLAEDFTKQTEVHFGRSSPGASVRILAWPFHFWHDLHSAPALREGNRASSAIVRCLCWLHKGIWHRWPHNPLDNGSLKSMDALITASSSSSTMKWRNKSQSAVNPVMPL